MRPNTDYCLFVHSIDAEVFIGPPGTTCASTVIGVVSYMFPPDATALQLRTLLPSLAASTSRGLTTSLLDDLADAAATTDPGSAGLIRQFRDEQYHRTGFTIGGVCPLAVARASIEVSRRALRSIDLRLHEASHPRIGVVDHVSVHPLGESGEECARQAGLIIATALGEEEGMPVLLYGDLKNGRRLSEVRVEGEEPHRSL